MRYKDPKIEVRKDVSRPFYFIRVLTPVFTENGIERKQKPQRLGFCDEMTITKAKQLKQQIMALANNQRLLVQAQVPFSLVIEKFEQARLPELGDATQEKYNTHLKNHVKPDLGKLELSEIDQPLLEAWLGKKKAGGMGYWARCDLKNLVSAIITKAIDWKIWGGDNPCTRIKIEKQAEVREKRLLADVDLKRLLEALGQCGVIVEGISGREVRLIVLIAFATGLRISEILGLKWWDFDAARGTVEVRRRWRRGKVGPPKTEASKRIRQLGPVAAELAGLYPNSKQNPEDYIFAGVGGNPPDDRNLNQHILRPVAVDLGIYWEGFGWHTFRRQNITWRQEAGATPFEAMRAAGHTKPSTTWLYTVTDHSREREQVEAMIGRLQGEVKPKKTKVVRMKRSA